jgi:hypothetical protein
LGVRPFLGVAAGVLELDNHQRKRRRRTLMVMEEDERSVA